MRCIARQPLIATTEGLLEVPFSFGPVRRFIARPLLWQVGRRMIEKPRVEAKLNTSTAAPRVVGGQENEPSAWGYNWAIRAIIAVVKLKKNNGRESRGACRQDELIVDKPPVVK
jgi:hypothetical protein